jgi:diguanylate cyclase (GGDEF)-like protein
VALAAGEAGTGAWRRYLVPGLTGALAPVAIVAAHRYIGAAEQRVIERYAVKVAEMVAQHAQLIVSGGVLGFTLVTFLSMRAAHRNRGLARRYEQLAKVDALTGLANRLAIEARMAERVTAARATGGGLGVMFIDVDDFKDINDSLGHAAGDEVLKTVAERMSSVLRGGDVIARYSGDEFVVLVGDVSDPGALAHVATKLLEAASPVVRVQDNDIFVTLSIGIAHYPADGADTATLLKNADSAMYRAKQRGRNGFQYFAAEMNAAAMEKLQMSSNLWRALKRNEFIVHYQPKEDARHPGVVLGYEALVRWNHPDQGLLAPGRFIPHAENSGAIEPLGEWVLAAALAQLRAWGSAFEGNIAVNLSMRQLYNPSLPATIRRELARHAVDPARLELEVTESMVSANPDVAARTLAELHRMGISIALDDFGTGQSSLAYLMRFPIRTLKIDRSFTADVPGSADACAIVRAIVALSRSLRMRVVAEGVETPEQLAFFQREGCDEIQGFLLGAPMPAHVVTQTLEARQTRILNPA